MEATGNNIIQDAIEREEEFLRNSSLFLDGVPAFQFTIAIQRGLTTEWPSGDEPMDYVRLDSMTLPPTPVELAGLRAFAEVRAFNIWADLYQRDPAGYKERFLSRMFLGDSYFRRTIVLRKRYRALGGWCWRDHRDWAWFPEPGQASHPLSLADLYTLCFHSRDGLAAFDLVFPRRISLWETDFPESHRAIMAAQSQELQEHG